MLRAGGMRTYLSRALLWTSLSCLPSSAALASAAGILGESGAQGHNCSGCHIGGGQATVALTGPLSVQGGTTANYSIRITGGPATQAGFDVYIDNAFAKIKSVDNSTTGDAHELTHFGPKGFAGGAATFNFAIDMPRIGGTIKLYASGLSANGGGTTGDAVGATVQTITVTGVPGAPLVATPADAKPKAVSTSFTDVTVLGADDSPEAQLIYSWAGAGAGPVTFAPNDTNAAKASRATFSKPGNYTLTVSIKDPSGNVTSSAVDVTVTPAIQSIDVIPAIAGVPPGATLQFGAEAKDQFGLALVSQPTFAWSATPGGSISATGLFKAGSSLGSQVIVQAAVSGRISAATVTIANGNAPTVATAPKANPSGLRAGLSVLGADDGGEAALKYTWSKASGPGTVTFSANGTNAAKQTIATFGLNGTYRLQVVIQDANNLGASASVEVNLTGEGGGGGGGGGTDDLLPPTVTLTLPSLELSGSVTLKAEAADETGVRDVVFMLDGEALFTATAPPYQATLDTKAKANGAHKIYAVAHDMAGNEARTREAEVTFSNTGGGGGDGGGCTSAGGGLLLSAAALAGLLRRRRRRA